MSFLLNPFIFAWVPLKIGGLVSWLDVSDSVNVELNGTNISEVTDKSNNSNSLVQATVSRQPELQSTINGLNTAVFDGVANCLESDGTIAPYMNSNHTMIGVIRKPSISATLMSARNAGGTINRYYINRSSVTRISLTLGNTPTYSGTDIDDNDVFLFGFEKNTNDFRFVTDGIPESYIVNPTMGDNYYYFAIGSIYDGTYNNFSKVQIGEYLVFNKQLTTEERQQVEGYLAHKWGLTLRLAFDHPYKYDGALFGYTDNWNPNEITTALWLDATDKNTITESSGAVSKWDDISGNNNHAVQPTGANQPSTLVENINGLNAISLDGIASFMNLTDDLLLKSTMVFIVYNTKTSSDGYLLSNAGAGASKSRFYIYEDRCDFGDTASFTVLEENTTYMSTSVVNGITDSSTQSYYVDGDLKDTDSVNRAYVEARFDIGDRDGASFNSCSVGEIVVIYDDITDLTRQKVEGYLAWKWGMNFKLPPDHPYRYDGRIFGKLNLWSPKNLTTAFWVDASQVTTITSSAGVVSQWDDISENSRHMTQGTASQQPVLGADYIQSDDINDLMQSSADITNFLDDSVMVYIVAKIPATGKSYDYVISCLDATGQRGFVIERDGTTDDLKFRIDSDTNYNQSVNTNVALDDTTCLVGFEAKSNNDRFVYKNGIASQLTDWIGSAFGWTNDSKIRIIECLGEYNEIIITTEKTEAEREKIEGYLAHKWGLMHKLPNDHPYKYDGTLFGYQKLWSPSDITTQLWLDALDIDTITESGGAVSQWNDISGNSRHVAQTVTASKPTYADSKITFDGTDDHLFNSSPFMWDKGEIDVYIVGSFSAASDKRIIAEGSSTDADPIYAISQVSNDGSFDKMASFIRNDSAVTVSAQADLNNTVAFDSTFKILNYKDDGDSIDGYINGVAGNDIAYTRSGTLTVDRFSIGALLRSTSSSFIAGDIKEVIITTGQTEFSRQLIEGYLAHKWGLEGSLASDHPYKTVAP